MIEKREIESGGVGRGAGSRDGAERRTCWECQRAPMAQSKGGAMW